MVASKAKRTRTSGRIKAQRKGGSRKIIDKETRARVLKKRLEALENDNYEEAHDGGDDAYVNDDDDVYSNSKKKGGKKKGGRKTGKTGKRRQKDVDIAQEHKSLEIIIIEEQYHKDDEDTANYLTIAAAPSVKPPRMICSVCGCMSKYTCIRCGTYFCSISCNHTHKETRCVKFAE